MATLIAFIDSLVTESTKQKARPHWLNEDGLWDKELAATYSRGTYRTTTIGKGAFDGRVRDGIGSGHTFMATNKI